MEVVVGFLAILLVIVLFYKYGYKIPGSSTRNVDFDVAPAGDESFDIDTVSPQVFRPFVKPNKGYKWSMALKNIPAEELFVLDKEYSKLINLRKKCMRDFPELCMGYDISCVPAIREFYRFTTDFLRTRYPMIFQLDPKSTHLKNSVTGAELPLNIEAMGVIDILKLLGESVTEDFMILLDNHPDHPQEYCLRGFTGCAPGGVDSTVKLNKPITMIHEPIPGFLEKLRFAITKFFNRLPPGEYMSRNNWFIQYSNPPRMFFFNGESEKTANHEMSCENFQANKRKLNPRLLDFNQVFLRTEKQSFIKLPQSRAAIMLVKTHVTLLNRVRDEERLGQELCEAIDGIQGNPRDYKGVEFWGEAMKKFLLGETDGITSEKYDYEFEY